MKVFIFSDPHIGYRPKSHVTIASAKRYEAKVLEQASKLVTSAQEGGYDAIFCLGDLFHNHSNREEVILDGAAIMGATDLCLNGNHDVLNVEDSVSSFDLAHQMKPYVVTEFTHRDAPYGLHKMGDTSFFMCCHYYTQRDFESAIREVCAAKSDSARNYLLLHCNVGEGYGEEVDPDDHSLYLTPELQELVSGNFDWTLVGHEHIARKIRDNIQIVGNTIPLSFGEMADRYTWVLDTDTNELTATKSLDIDTHLVHLTPEDIGVEELPEGTWWVDIHGELPAERRPEINRWIAKIWKSNPDLLSIRNGIEYARADNTVNAARAQAQDLRQLITLSAEAAGFGEELKELGL